MTTYSISRPAFQPPAAPAIALALLLPRERSAHPTNVYLDDRSIAAPCELQRRSDALTSVVPVSSRQARILFFVLDNAISRRRYQADIKRAPAMREKIVISLFVSAGVFAGLVEIKPALGQTAATATVSGVVSDASGALVPGAKVALLDKATGLARTQETSSTGQYIFANVLPGSDTITITMERFVQAEVQLSVEIAKSYNINVTLKGGGPKEPVDVIAGAGAELQTLDATVGNVVQGEEMVRLPNINRSAMVYYDLQPLVAPTYRTGGINQVNSQGTVAGPRRDNSTRTE